MSFLYEAVHTLIRCASTSWVIKYGSTRIFIDQIGYLKNPYGFRVFFLVLKQLKLFKQSINKIEKRYKSCRRLEKRREEKEGLVLLCIFLLFFAPSSSNLQFFFLFFLFFTSLKISAWRRWHGSGSWKAPLPFFIHSYHIVNIFLSKEKGPIVLVDEEDFKWEEGVHVEDEKENNDFAGKFSSDSDWWVMMVHMLCFWGQLQDNYLEWNKFKLKTMEN